MSYCSRYYLEVSGIQGCYDMCR